MNDTPPLSSANLIRAGKMTPGPSLRVWRADGAASPPEPVAIKALDARGMPFSAFTLLLGTGEGRVKRIEQDVDAPLQGGKPHVLRVTARSLAGPSRLSLRLKRRADNAVLHAAQVEAGQDWARRRMPFQPSETHAASTLTLEIVVDSGDVEITDIRLVALHGEAPGLSVRFDTRGSVLLPSTRLRALMIEDHLDLLGWRSSVNAGSGYDLLVCQKTTPWLRMLAARMAGRRVVYDLDDDELIEGFARRLRVSTFARCATDVTAGSVPLQDKLSRYQSSVELLENPVDVMNVDLMRDAGPWRHRLVWFGMPENLWMLEQLALDRPVTTVTRGGTVEYDLLTIDQTLISHDLALLPVSLNEHTRAKNANRLVKCVALGLPFLASATEENRRAIDLLGLDPSSCLVGPDENWSERIDATAAEYPSLLERIAAARRVVFDAYGVDNIVSHWARRRLAAMPAPA